MWAEVSGERKKVACGPCIRGHRSSKCDHRDRVLVEVRKPGRPLSSCPHPTGSCSCERVVINYTIPKTSECACPSERAQPAAVFGGSGRVQKGRNRKSVSTFSPSVLEKALKASQDGETDSSSLLTRTPTSETNSVPSSASSTPRILPVRKETTGVEYSLTESSAPTSRPTTSHAQGVSSCCQPKAVPPQQGGSCCSGKAKESPKPIQPKAPAKSCCSGPASAPPVQPQFAPPGGRPNTGNAFGHIPQYPGPFQHQAYGMANQSNGFMPMPAPYNFNTPIYNHVGAVYQPPASMPMTPMHSHIGAQANEHNCHCGDSCSCFGCAAHPNNATMIEYIRSMHQYMSTGQFGAIPPPIYDLPAFPHQAGYGAEAGMTFNNPTPTNFLATNHFQTSMARTLSLPMASLNASSPWPQSATHTPIHAPPSMQGQYFEASDDDTTPTAYEQPTPSLKAEESIQSPTFTDSPSEGKDEEAPTLSPSSYFWQEVTLPGCNDATGTCQCGDGCECVGCLTHGGHNGVPLEIPAVNEDQPAFPDFVPPNDMISSGANQFIPYANAPT